MGSRPLLTSLNICSPNSSVEFTSQSPLQTLFSLVFLKCLPLINRNLVKWLLFTWLIPQFPHLKATFGISCFLSCIRQNPSPNVYNSSPPPKTLSKSLEVCDWQIPLRCWRTAQSRVKCLWGSTSGNTSLWILTDSGYKRDGKQQVSVSKAHVFKAGSTIVSGRKVGCWGRGLEGGVASWPPWAPNTICCPATGPKQG